MLKHLSSRSEVLASWAVLMSVWILIPQIVLI
ncbi:hypothetical protein FHS49_001842 [Sphingobium boeckii]|uniref:Uncharacterized protein n=1 Tax=Sphingobium boeckii TaxID=1082345 RepID=A0A7W9AHY7_9SPHN|nr:hypothetical protein [Sphingobium boeckii]